MSKFERFEDIEAWSENVGTLKRGNVDMSKFERFEDIEAWSENVGTLKR